MTQELAASMGSCQALMHLATDAVQAAIDSPFLEKLASQATGALCCVSLPSGVLPLLCHLKVMCLRHKVHGSISSAYLRLGSCVPCGDGKSFVTSWGLHSSLMPQALDFI